MTGSSRLEGFRRSSIFPAFLLGCFALIAGAALSGGNYLTRDAILARQAEDLRASITQVVPADLYTNNLLQDTVTISNPSGEEFLVYRARLDKTPTAFVFQVSEPGYGGEIRIIIGIATDGTLLGVRVLAHTETPGLGDKIEAEKDSWILGFKGLSLGNPAANLWLVKKDGGVFDQFSGATITPRAVVKAVKKGLALFAANREFLLAPETETEK